MGAELNKTVGALLIGTLLTSVGFGITTMQTYMWYRNYPEDPKWIRVVVWTILVLDTLHIMLGMHAIYYYLILNFDNAPALKLCVWSFDSTIIVTAVITCIAHAFYARRIYILANKNWFIPITIGMLSFIRLFFGCYIPRRMLQIKVVAELPQKVGAQVAVGMGAGSLADWIVTASLVFLLRRRKSGIKETNNLLDRLIYWTVNNGLLTSILGLCVIVTLLAMPDNMIFFAFHLLLSKLYANSLLVTLNYRSVVRGRGVDDSTPGYPLSLLGPSQPSNGLSFNSRQSAKVAGVAPVVHVVTTTINDGSIQDDTAVDGSGEAHQSGPHFAKVYGFGDK